MRPLDRLERKEAARLRGIVFDLDDTVLDHGRLSLGAYAAVCRAAEAGLTLVVATGRPLGWAEVVSRTWPVTLAIAENGAVAAAREGEGIVRLDTVSPSERGARTARLVSVVDEIQRSHADAALADDNALRLTDRTFDIGETRVVPEADIARLSGLARALGARTLASSVHLHVSFDAFDKASGALHFLATRLDLDPSLARERFAFVGDSSNDAPCFAAFRTTFGVANVRAHLHKLTLPPRYVAPSPMGRGFAEIVNAIVEKRSAGG